MSDKTQSVDEAIKRGETAGRLLGSPDFQEFLEWLRYKKINFYKAKKNAKNMRKTEITESGGHRSITTKAMTPIEQLLYIRGVEEYIEALDAVIDLAGKNSETARRHKDERVKRGTPSSTANS